MAQPEKRGRGCLLYTGIVAMLAVLVAIAAGWAATHYTKRIINEFTTARPIPITNAPLSASEQERLNGRILDFDTALGQSKPAEPLGLSSTEANALIGTETNLLYLRDHFTIVSLSSGQISGLMSFPADQLGLAPLRGRFINATGTFSIEVRSNQIQLNAVSLSTPEGRRFPADFEQALRMRNLAADLNAVAEFTNALNRIHSIEVHTGMLLILPKN